MGFGLHIEIRATYWDYKFRNIDWDYGYRLGLRLQFEITATDWDLAFRLELRLKIGIRATDWDYNFKTTNLD